MPITKFATYADAEQALWCFQPDQAYFKRIRDLWMLANRLSPPNFPKGIFKYQSLAEANLQKEEWIVSQALIRLKKKSITSRQRNLGKS